MAESETAIDEGGLKDDVDRRPFMTKFEIGFNWLVETDKGVWL